MTKSMTNETILEMIKDELCEGDLIELSYDHIDLNRVDANKIKVIYRIDLIEDEVFMIYWMTNLHNYFKLTGQVVADGLAIDVVEKVSQGEILATAITELTGDTLSELGKRINQFSNGGHRSEICNLTIYNHIDPKYN